MQHQQQCTRSIDKKFWLFAGDSSHPTDSFRHPQKARREKTDIEAYILKLNNFGLDNGEYFRA